MNPNQNPSVTGRNNFLAALSRKTMPGRVPLAEICFWPETLKRWRQEGLPVGADVYDYFGIDKIFIHYPFDGSLLLEPRVIEDNKDYKVELNSDGVTMQSWKTTYAPPSEIDFLIKNHEDWKRLKHRFEIHAERFQKNIEIEFQKATGSNLLRIVSPFEPLWYVLRTLGFVRALEAMALEPEFIDDMVGTYTDFILSMLQMLIEKGLKYDGLWFFSDLCYKNGMLFSPRLYQERFQSYHLKIARFCRENRLLLMLHCDGDVREFLPLLIETGFDCIQPLEARAGNDVRKLKAEYGTQLCLFGNINMDILARGDQGEIADEVISKVECAKQGGGYVFHSDHSVPPTVSFENYCLALELAKKHGNY